MSRITKLLLIGTLIIQTVYGQDLVITKQQDTLHCTVIETTMDQVLIKLIANNATADSTLPANTIESVVLNVHNTTKKDKEPRVAMRTTTTGDTIYGNFFFENDSLQYFRYKDITQAAPKHLLIPIVSYVRKSDVNQAAFSLKKKKQPKKGPTQQAYIGYQIGGITMAGIDLVYGYPVAFHVGAGFAGYTIGLRIYPKPKNSVNINLSYKDGGFGLIRVLGAEVGGNLIPIGSNGGLHVQFGLGAITGIDPDFSDQLFGRQDTPSAMLLLGIGFKIL